jgi:hypothetical protein
LAGVAAPTREVKAAQERARSDGDIAVREAAREALARVEAPAMGLSAQAAAHDNF